VSSWVGFRVVADRSRLRLNEDTDMIDFLWECVVISFKAEIGALIVAISFVLFAVFSLAVWLVAVAVNPWDKARKTNGD
jgi:hypothetical protein